MSQSLRVQAFSLELNLVRLRQKHRAIKDRIAGELKRPAPCTMTLQTLKRKRLQIKDDLHRAAEVLRKIDERLARLTATA